MKRLCMLGMLMVLSSALYAEEPAAAPSAEKIKSWVGDLASEDFQKRHGAEMELLKAGPGAQKPLEAAATSPDAQVRATAQRLLGKLKLSSTSNIDYLEVIPTELMIAVQIKNSASLIENSKQTAVGKLFLSEDLAKVRAAIQAEMKKDPAKLQVATKWFDRFQGQAMLSVWDLNLVAPDQMRVGVVVEITDPNPKQVLGELLKTMNAADVQNQTYKEVDVAVDANSGVAAALIGKHLLFAPNLESAKKLIDGFVTPGGFKQSANYSQIKSALGAKPEFIFAMDLQAYMKAIAKIVPGAGMQEMMAGAGSDFKLLGMSTTCAGESFEDRVVAMGGTLTGMAAASRPPAGAPAPLDAMVYVPPNAVAAAMTYLDGALLYKGLLEYMGGLQKMMAGNVPPNGPKPPDLETAIKEFETKTQIKLSDLLANIKGDTGYWAVLAPGGVLAPPDLGVMLTCADAEKAKAVSDALVKALNAYSLQPAVQDVTVGKRSIYILDLSKLGAILPPNFPYTISWGIAENRIFVGSSQQALRKQLSYIDNKTPGLLTSPEFVKALGMMTAEERKGQLMYVDMKSLLTVGATIGLPLLQTQITDPAAKANLAALPIPEKLFKDIPPLIVSSTYRDKNVETVMRSPLPPFLIAVLTGVTIPIIQNKMNRAGRAEEVPPGGF